MTMCFLCGKEIAWPRSMVDRQYCSAEHRKEARLASANALREGRGDIAYEIDGAVVKVNELDLHAQLGATSRAPR